MLKTLIFSFFLALLTICQIGCKSSSKFKKSDNVKEFEGLITYHEIIKNSDSSFNIDDTVNLFYSHGNYVSIHSAVSPNFHLVKDYYLKSKPLRLFLFNNSDTLHELKLNSETENLVSFSVEKIKEKLLSRSCERIKINTSYSEKDSTTYSDFSLVFSRGYLNVDKQYFRNWQLGYFNKVIDETGAFYLKLQTVHYDSSHKNILSSKSYEAISVKEMPVNPVLFEIDTSKIKRDN